MECYYFLLVSQTGGCKIKAHKSTLKNLGVHIWEGEQEWGFTWSSYWIQRAKSRDRVTQLADCFGWSRSALQSDSFPVFGQDRGKLGTHKFDVVLIAIFYQISRQDFMTGMDSILPLKTRDSQRKPCKPMVPVSPASPWGSIFSSLLLSCFPRGALRVFQFNHNLPHTGIW